MAHAMPKPKLFRDPVHDTIALPQESPGDRLLVVLLDTAEMQRLRRIRQLGLTNLVYPGAEHSRFQHSLGVLWLAHQMLARLGRRVSIGQDTRTIVLVGALLHDVGHGPMSHALEAVTGIRHERWTEAIIRAPDSGIGRVLRAHDPGLPDRIVALFGKGPLPAGTPAFAREIVSSQLDADRLDYILRDGHATGVRIGSYDLARIMALLEPTQDGAGAADQHLAIHVGAQEAVEGYLLARFHMYKQVYLHTPSRAAERMLEAALRRAALLGRGGADPFGRLIRGETLSPSEFATLDDVDVLAALKRWTDDADPSLADLARGLVGGRALWKPLALAGDETRAAEQIEAARAVARVRGYEPDAAVLVDTSRDSLYRPFTGLRAAGDTSHDDSIRLVDGEGRAAFIEDRSEVVKMLAHLEVRQRLLCVHPGIRDPVAKTLRVAADA